MIEHIFFGFIVGIVAKLLTPGYDPGEVILTIVLGMAGGWIGGQLGQWLGGYEPGDPAGFIMAVVGAILLLVVYRAAFQRSPAPHVLYAPPGDGAGSAGISAARTADDLILDRDPRIGLLCSGLLSRRTGSVQLQRVQWRILAEHLHRRTQRQRRLARRGLVHRGARDRRRSHHQIDDQQHGIVR